MQLKSLLFLCSFLIISFANGQTIQKTNFITETCPQYMSAGSNATLGAIFRANVFALTPGETYYYYVRGVAASDIGTSFAGVGGSLLFTVDSPTRYAASADFSVPGTYDSFMVTGPFYSNWFGFTDTNNTRFTAGNYIIPMITIKNADPMSSFKVRFALNDSIKVLNFNTSAGSNNGTAIYGLSKGSDKEIVTIYDTNLGVKRPLAIALIESDKLAASAYSAPTFYKNNVDGIGAAWGAILPNTLSKGVRRIERRSLANNTLLHTQLDTNGTLLAVDTKNPSGGSSTPIKLTTDEAALVPTEVVFSTPFVTIDESLDSFTVVVERKYSTEDTARVTVSLVGGTATDGLDFNFPGNITFTFAPGSLVSDSFKMNIVDDNLTEGQELLTLKLINPVNCVIGTGSTLSLTINDNDVPTIKFVDKIFVTREGLGDVKARVAIENGTVGTTTVRAAVKTKSPLTNIPAEFYLGLLDPNDTLLSYANGFANDTLRLNCFIVDDMAIDAPDTIIIVLKNPSGTAIIGADSILTIIVKDNDAPPAVRFLSSGVTVDENVGTAQIQVELLNRNNSPSDFTLKYIASRSATTEGSDLTFNPTSQIYSFGLTGADTMTINIPIIDDMLFEMNEDAVFAVEGTVNNSTQKPDTFRLTIVSNDLEKLTIAAASTINPTTGVLTKNGDKCVVSGITHGFNRTTIGLEFTLIDATGGMQMAATSTFGYTLEEGDSINAFGTIGQQRGVAQLVMDSVKVIKKAAPTYPAAVVTKLSETTEQEIVEVRNVKFIDIANWPVAAMAANNEAFARAINANNDTLFVRIDAEGPLNGTASPKLNLYYHITGIGSQRDITSPFLSGYYLDPSKLSDLKLANSPTVSFEKTAITIAETADSTPRIKVLIANSGFQNTGFRIDKSPASSATISTDYTFSPIVLNLIPSISSYEFQVDIIDDNLKDGNKTIVLVLNNPGFGVIVGADSVMTITISDDESSIQQLDPALVAIYPNPTTGNITFESKNNINNVRVYDINGLEIINQKIENNNLSLSKYSPGIYQLVLEIDGELFSTRIQKH